MGTKSSRAEVSLVQSGGQACGRFGGSQGVLVAQGGLPTFKPGRHCAGKVMALVDAADDANWEEVLGLLRAGLRLSLLHDFVP